jgi:prophage tail gpP-like protein
MTQPFDLRISGKSVPVKNAKFIDSMNSVADGFTAQIVVNRETQPELYNAIKPYQYTPATVYIEGELALTGKITKTTPRKNENGEVYSIAGFSNTFNFIDSDLVPPYTFDNQDLHQIAQAVAKQTATQVVFETEAGGQFKGAAAKPGQTGFEFLAPLAKQRNQVMSCNAEGNLIFQQSNLELQSVGSIVENDPKSLLQKEFSIDFDGRKRFKTYKVKGQTPAGSAEGTSTDKNISQPRHKLVAVNGQVAGAMSETADWQKNITLIEALTFQTPVVGWIAPNKTRWKSNTLVSIQSETMFIPDGFTFLIRSVELNYDESSGKTALLSVIPPNIYTKKEVVEPWFS